MLSGVATPPPVLLDDTPPSLVPPPVLSQDTPPIDGVHTFDFRGGSEQKTDEPQEFSMRIR